MLAETGQLPELLPVSELHLPIADKLTQLLARAPLLAFIRGSPDFPECDESRELVELLRGVPFAHFDVAKDPEIREAVARRSHWPHFPQLYHDSKLVGGLDVVSQLAETGEL